MKRKTRNGQRETKPLTIVIDCRFWGLHNTGFGRYTMHLVNELAKLDHHNQYYLLFRKAAYDNLTPPDPLFKKEGDSLSSDEERARVSLNSNNCPITQLPNFHPILLGAPPYTIKEQLLLAKVLHQLKPDIYHAIDMNIPLLFSGKLITTIHDLTRFQNINNQVTTLPLPLYYLKYFLSKFIVLQKALHASTAIITPSEYVKNQLTTKNQKLKTRIYSIPEAPDPIYYQKSNSLTMKQFNNLKSPYLIYTGNVYPHKNLPNLLEAIKIFNQKPKTKNQKLTLSIACSRNLFRDRVEKYAQQLGVAEYVNFLGFVPDADLRELYRHSLAFITPSLSEGFGLPGLEAMAAGTLVLSSNATCLPEIYGDHAIYFDPHNPQDIADKIHHALGMKPSDRQKLITQAHQYSQTFSWQKLAEEIFKLYQSI